MKTCTKLYKSTERLRSNYDSELQSRKMDKWPTNQGIVFKPSIPYFQEENEVYECTGCTIMKIIRATILERGMNNTFWPEVFLVMTHIKNLRLKQALEGWMSPATMRDKNLSNFHHLCILSLPLYVFFHEEECTLKSEKCDVRALKKKLVRFDRHTIYKVHIAIPWPNLTQPYQTLIESQCSMPHKYQMSKVYSTKAAPPKTRRQTKAFPKTQEDSS